MSEVTIKKEKTEKGREKERQRKEKKRKRRNGFKQLNRGEEIDSFRIMGVGGGVLECACLF